MGEFLIQDCVTEEEEMMHFFVFTNVQVAQFKTNLDFDCIIGMDIIRKGDMALTNAKDEMVFTFRIPPAETHIDFLKEKIK